MGVVQENSTAIVDGETCENIYPTRISERAPVYPGGRQCIYLNSTEETFTYGYTDCMKLFPFVCTNRGLFYIKKY